MLGTWRLRRLLRNAVRSDAPERALNRSNKALNYIAKLQSWPLVSPSQDEAVVRLLLCRGRATLELSALDPQLAERALVDLEAAATLGESIGSPVEIEAKFFTAVAYHDLQSGSISENSISALKYANSALETALKAGDKRLEYMLHSLIAQIFDGHRDGSLRQNAAKAVVHQRSALQVAESNLQPFDKKLAAGKLADLLIKREDGDKSANFEEAIQLAQGAIADWPSDAPLAAKADMMMALAHAYIDRIEGPPTENIKRGLRIAAEVGEILRPSKGSEGWAHYNFSMATIWGNLRSGIVFDSKARALSAIDEALEFYEPQNWPHQYLKLTAMKEAVLADLKVTMNASVAPIGDGSAISSARETLATLDPERDLISWADSAVSLVRVLMKGPAEQQPTALDEAHALLLDLRQRISAETHGEHWRVTGILLAEAKIGLLSGDPIQNRLDAEEILHQTLASLSPSANRDEWLRANILLAGLIANRISGSPADNDEQALAIVERCLVVADSQSRPFIRARLQAAAGSLLQDRFRGEKSDNLNRTSSALGQAIDLFRAAGDESSAAAAENALRVAQRELTSLNESTERGLVHSSADKGLSPKDSLKRRGTIRSRGASFLSPSRSREALSRHVYAQIDVARHLAHASPDKDRVGSVEEFTEFFAESHREAIGVLRSLEPEVSKETGPGLWADVQYEIAGLSRMMQLWADFRRLGGRNLSHEESAVRRGAAAAEAALRQAAAALREVTEVYSAERAPLLHLGFASRLGRYQLELGDAPAAVASFRSAAHAANRTLAALELGQTEFEAVLDQLCDLAGAGPLAALRVNANDLALEIAEAGRARLIGSRSAKNQWLRAHGTTQLYASLVSRMERLEKSLADPKTIDRYPAIQQFIDVKGQAFNLFYGMPDAAGTDAAALKQMMHANASPTTVYVMLVASEMGGALCAFFVDGKSMRSVSIPIPAGKRLFSVFSEGIAGGTDTWQLGYLEQQRTVPSDPDAWETTLDEVSDSLTDAYGEYLDALLSEVGAALGEDVLDLMLMPNGAVGLMPLCLIKLAKSEVALIEKHIITVLPSITHLNTKIVTNAKSSAIMYDLDFGQVAGPLRFAPFEAASIASNYDEAIVCKVSTHNKQHIQEKLKSATVWHFIGHGNSHFRETSRYTLTLGKSVEFTPNDLTEICGDDPPQLVILSACATGLFGLERLPDEYMGLPAAFLQAGVPTVIAPLWPVDDVPAALLMSRLHVEFAVRERTPGAALRRAQLWLKELNVEDTLLELDRWQELGISEPTARSELKGLRRELQKSGGMPHEKPFSDKQCWAGYICYGI